MPDDRAVVHQERIGDPAKPAHVECALQVDLVNANPNAAMQVLRLDRDEPKGFRRQSAIPDPEHGSLDLPHEVNA